jgi:hypothetical protein
MRGDGGVGLGWRVGVVFVDWLFHVKPGFGLSRPVRGLRSAAVLELCFPGDTWGGAFGGVLGYQVIGVRGL